MRAVTLACALALAAAATAAAQPARIVSLGGDITEIVYACGASDRLVGVDTTSIYPPAATALPQVGYVRSLNAEGVLSLGPDLVLGTTEAGPPEVIEQLRSAGVEMLLIPEDNSAANVERKIRDVANVVGRPACADRLIGAMRDRLADVDTRLETLGAATERPRVLFILNIAAGGPPLAGGADTGADEVIRLAGGANAAAGFSGYKPMAPEALVATAPDVIVMFDDRLASLGGEAGLAAMPGFAPTPALAGHRVHGLDGLLLLGFGPRLGEAVWQLNRLLYPETPHAAD